MNDQKKKLYKCVKKLSNDELQLWLYFKHRGYTMKNRKGKGSYSRKLKYKSELEK